MAEKDRDKDKDRDKKASDFQVKPSQTDGGIPLAPPEPIDGPLPLRSVETRREVDVEGAGKHVISDPAADHLRMPGPPPEPTPRPGPGPDPVAPSAEYAQPKGAEAPTPEPPADPSALLEELKDQHRKFEHTPPLKGADSKRLWELHYLIHGLPIPGK